MGAVALLGLVCSLFREAVFGGQFLYGRDLGAFWRPQMETMIRILASGSWPLWDPYASFGRPLLGQPQTQMFYPTTWLNLILPPTPLYTLYTVVHLTGSGIGLMLLARRLGVSRAGALVAAALWTTSGPVLSLVSLWHHFAGAAWIPWVLLAADEAMGSGRRRATLLLGLALALQIFAGSADMCVLTAPGLALVCARHVDWRTLRDPRHWRLVRTGLVSGGLALALTACQWLPTLEIASRSSRFHLPELVRTFWSLRPVELIQLVVPVFLSGLPLRPELRALLGDGRDPFLTSLYLGLPALALVAASFLPGRREVVAVACLGLFGALVALGRHAVFYRVLIVLLPPIQILRYPVKAMTLVALAWALLAGFGFDAWTADQARRSRWRLVVVGPLALGVGLAWGVVWFMRGGADQWGARFLTAPAGVRLSQLLAPAASWVAFSAVLGGLVLVLAAVRPHAQHYASVAAALVAVVCVAELFNIHRGLNPTLPSAVLEARPPVLARVPRDAGRLYIYEYFSVPGSAEHYLGHPLATAPEKVAGWRTEMAGALAARLYPLPSIVETWGHSTGFEMDPLGLFGDRLLELTYRLRDVEETPLHHRLLRIGAVGHVVALHRRGLEDLDLIEELPTLYPESLKVFRVADALPRVYVVGGMRAVPPGSTVDALLAPDFDPAREVVIAAEGGPAARPVAPSDAAPFSGRVRRADLMADRLRVEVELDRDGYLVVVDAWDPGWKATLDGAPARVLPANAAFRAVAVPRGRHVVEQVYRPASLLAGLAVSGLAVVGILGVWAARSRPERPA